MDENEIEHRNHMRKPALAFSMPLLPVLTFLLSPAPRCEALTFNVTFDATTAGAPSGFFSAFRAAIDLFQTNYDDPITINLQVGWGKINGQNLSPGNLGQSSTFQPAFYQYSQIRTALMNDARSAEDAEAVMNLSSTDPTGGAQFTMANAEAKALGLLAANAPGLDGFVGFSTNAVYNFDVHNRAVPGQYDFFGLACHEISEAMGRYGLGQNGASSGRYGPIDLFRYLSPGVLDLAPANGAYFSIDGGNSLLDTFNGIGGGDLSDWSGQTLDSFNHSLAQGQRLDVSAADLIVMDVIGYNRVFTPPTLQVARSGLNLMISWSSTLSNFILQTNSDLATTNWSPANLSVSTANGTNYSATISPLANGNLFFRLKR